MKITRPALILFGAAWALSLGYSQQLATEAPTKAQQILRQKIAELNSAESLPSKEQLLADVERLHKEGKISDEQLETFRKNIREQYLAPTSPASPEAQAKAQVVLEQKISELNAGQKPELPAPRETGPVAEQVLRQKIAESQAPEKTEVIPATATATRTPELEAKERELLRLKIAEGRKNDPARSQSNSEAQTKALDVLHQREAESQAGITPDTPEQTRILRLKIAESKGILSPEEAAAASAASRAAPAVGSSPVTIQTSNKVGLARLNELTELYKADRITPSEYHRERAKIVPSL